jgi:hypothetical protein
MTPTHDPVATTPDPRSTTTTQHPTPQPSTPRSSPEMHFTHNTTTDPPPPYTKPTQNPSPPAQQPTPVDHQETAQPDTAEGPKLAQTPEILQHQTNLLGHIPRQHRARGLGTVIPGDTSVIGENVPGTRPMRISVRCYVCGIQGFHQAASCAANAARIIGAPFPGWTAEGTKIPSHWTSPTTISRACAQEWIQYLKVHNITGNPCITGQFAPPAFAAVR